MLYVTGDISLMHFPSLRFIGAQILSSLLENASLLKEKKLRNNKRQNINRERYEKKVGDNGENK
jgi:hypothetical protein